LVLNVVKKAEALVAADKSLNHEYLDISGDPKFVNLSRAVLFGKDSPAIKEGRIVSAQSLSGTGALRLGSEFIQRFLPKGTTIYYSVSRAHAHQPPHTASTTPSPLSKWGRQH
jgi:aspartate aminotransferase